MTSPTLTLTTVPNCSGAIRISEPVTGAIGELHAATPCATRNTAERDDCDVRYATHPQMETVSRKGQEGNWPLRMSHRATGRASLRPFRSQASRDRGCNL